MTWISVLINTQVTLELSFMETVQGCAKTVSFQAAVACEACGGSGVPPGTRPESCKRCKGSGMVRAGTQPGQKAVLKKKGKEVINLYNSISCTADKNFEFPSLNNC
ncbi:chaperone protein dnaJ 1 [Pyrus ussuriensis x Pyrus communis]|uniref:Chaperone protein dnaJ 1 n=1 Tax=Pyrus ussuriensis x Pyrus communis TaxID=2448454 RepID=A0A5N5EUI7_9ROSA|nr:chaperone protein dnaJ 1 [Pyrus ussuriensis x Pyrus communis]